MIVYIVLCGAIVYVAGWTAWRLFLVRTAKESNARESRATALFGRLFGGSWIYPTSAIALAAILFFFGADIGLVNRWSEQERAELDHFVAAVSYYDDASQLYSNRPKLSYQDWESVNAMLQAALAEGEQVSPKLLKKLHPELQKKYQERFLAGLRTGTYGLWYFTSTPKKVNEDTVDNHSSDSLNEGRRLLGEWNKWFEPNRAQILEKMD